MTPEWYGYRDSDDEGEMKVVVTTVAVDDGPRFQPHMGNKTQLTELATDSIRLVIVHDMWLPGFDATCLCRPYVDKPMQGHGIMQAIAPMNRADNLGHQQLRGVMRDHFLCASDVRGMREVALACWACLGHETCVTARTADLPPDMAWSELPDTVLRLSGAEDVASEVKIHHLAQVRCERPFRCEVADRPCGGAPVISVLSIDSVFMYPHQSDILVRVQDVHAHEPEFLPDKIPEQRSRVRSFCSEIQTIESPAAQMTQGMGGGVT